MNPKEMIMDVLGHGYFRGEVGKKIFTTFGTQSNLTYFYSDSEAIGGNLPQTEN